MKNIAYHIIITVVYVLSIPLDIATAVCQIMRLVHNAVHALVNIAFDREDPYKPLRDLVRTAKADLDAYAEFYNSF